MKRTTLSLPAGIWTFVILSGCAAIQVASEVQLGRNALQTGQPQVAVGYLQNAAELDPDYKTPYSIRESVMDLPGPSLLRDWQFSGSSSGARKGFVHRQRQSPP